MLESIEIIKIILIEDDPDDAALIQRMITGDPANKFEIEWKEKLTDAISWLEENNVSIILSDLNLPESRGLKTFHILNESYPHIPTILLTGFGDQDIAFLAVREGAQDFLLKSELNSSLLIRSIKYAIERKRAAIQLSRLASVIEQSSESVLITDLDGVIQYVNPAFEKASGYSKIELIGEKPSILKSGQHDEDLYKNLWETIVAGKTWNGILTNKHKNGSFYYVDVVIFPIKDEAGNIINYAAVKRNITSEKSLEEQLQQTQKMEAIGQLAGGIAHDFNNILTYINGTAELSLINMEADNPYHKEFTSILKAGRKAGALTRQLLAFSRKQIMTLQIININSLISDLEKMLNRLIGEDIKLKLNFTKKIKYIKADPGQLEQILINLIVNARDAINQKTDIASQKEIIIKTTNETVEKNVDPNLSELKEGEYVVISVIDNGIGIDDKTIPKIFEPFFTTKKAGHGTGMGLSTVYGIVKQNNAYIQVTSKKNKETTFTIYWSVIKEKKKKQKSEKISEVTKKGCETILFVEDDNAIKTLASDALVSLGYKVISASNGKEAMQIIDSNNLQFDLIITDIVMPDMGGKELADKLKKAKPDIKILFTSGYTDRQITIEVVENNELNFLQKPYSIFQLSKRIREIIEKA